MLLTSEIELPKEKDVAAFGEFMRDEYIPAVERGPTRIGRVEELELVQSAEAGPADGPTHFLLLVRWNGLEHEAAGAHVDEKVSRKFERFGARMKQQARWLEVARQA